MNATQSSSLKEILFSFLRTRTVDAKRTLHCHAICWKIRRSGRDLTLMSGVRSRAGVSLCSQHPTPQLFLCAPASNNKRPFVKRMMEQSINPACSIGRSRKPLVNKTAFCVRCASDNIRHGIHIFLELLRHRHRMGFWKSLFFYPTSTTMVIDMEIVPSNRKPFIQCNWKFHLVMHGI